MVEDDVSTSVSSLYVDKSAETASDVLLAGGLARLAERLYQNVEHRVTIRDVGACYEIELTPALALDQVRTTQDTSLIRPLMTAAKQAKAVTKGRIIDGFDYDGQRELRTKYAKARQALKGQLRSPEAALYQEDLLKQELGDGMDLDPQLPLYDAFNAFKIGNSLNELVHAWETLPQPALEAVLVAVFQAFSRTPNDLEQLTRQWKMIAKDHRLSTKERATQLQITNPAAGKGANEAKANAIKPDNLDQLWLLELLKLAGYFPLAASVAIRTSSGTTKDRKTFILRPQQVELGRIEPMMVKFREVLWASTAVKLDVLAVLRFTEIFLEFRRRQLLDEQDEPDDTTLTKLAQGFDVVFSKDMGSALATMNLSQLNLPTWLPPIESLADTKRVQLLIREHLSIVRSVGTRGPGKANEEGSEEYELLRHYRDFLSSRNDITAFLRFTTAYGPYVMSQRYHKRYCPQLSESQLEVLMDHPESKLQEIIHDQGFRRIAACIRQATVGAQYRVAELKDKRYVIRYGLGQELARTAKDNDEFVIALSKFVQSYRAENAREEEKIARNLPGPISLTERRRLRLRINTREDDLDAVITLVSRFGAELVCPMLLAYGYAKSKAAPKEITLDSDEGTIGGDISGGEDSNAGVDVESDEIGELDGEQLS